MNLEQVEEICVSFLAQTASPTVPFSALYRHAVRQGQMVEMSENELLAFLRENPLFRVIEGEDCSGATESSGKVEEPRVVLCTRIPTQKELVGQIDAEIDKMVGALQRAMFEAAREGDEKRRDQILDMIKRAESLRERLDTEI